MNNETLNRANYINGQMAGIEKLLSQIEKNKTVVEISFCNGGYCCCSNQSAYLSDEEVAQFKDEITELIRSRAQAQLEELQNEFNNL